MSDILTPAQGRILRSCQSLIRAEKAWSSLPLDKRDSLPVALHKSLSRIGFTAQALKRSLASAAPAMREACKKVNGSTEFAMAAHVEACVDISNTITRAEAILAGF